MIQTLSNLAHKGLNFLLPGCTKLKPHYDPREIPNKITDTFVGGDISVYPRISMVVPSFNQGHFLGETLKSITEQRYPNLELIVVDGGSSDATLEVIKEYENISIIFLISGV